MAKLKGKIKYLDIDAALAWIEEEQNENSNN